MDEAIAHIEAARAKALRITADMYAYPAGATGLDAAMPPWVQAGGNEAWFERLKDPGDRASASQRRCAPTTADWENLMRAAAAPENVLLVGFKTRAEEIHRQDARRGREGCAARARRTRRWTSSSRTARASAPSIS